MRAFRQYFDGSHRRLGLVLGLVAVAIVTLLRYALAAVVGENMPLLLYVLAVLIAASLGGMTPGLVVTAVSAILGSVLFVTLAPDTVTGELVRLTTFVIEGVAISLAFSTLAARNRELRHLAEDLAESRDHAARMAMTDWLTGMPNRTAYEADIRASIARADRDGVPLMLVVADADGLKRVNDRYGHAGGDELLRLVADTLSRAVRVGDRAYRVGGDEFVVILHGVSDATSEQPFHRLADALEVVPVRFPEAGVSMGAASYPAEADDPDRLFELADERMYEEKLRRGSGRRVG